MTDPTAPCSRFRILGGNSFGFPVGSAIDNLAAIIRARPTSNTSDTELVNLRRIFVSATAVEIQLTQPQATRFWTSVRLSASAPWIDLIEVASTTLRIEDSIMPPDFPLLSEGKRLR